MKQAKRWSNTGRLMLVGIVGIFGLCYIAIAYLFLDIAVRGEKKGVDLYQYALDIYLVKETVQGERGTIFDKHGHPLAEQLTSYTLYANLYEPYGDRVEDVSHTAQQLSQVIDMSAEEITNRLTKEGAKQVEFGNAGKGLTYLEKEAIAALELSGLRFRENVRRLYPNGVFASHTLGYTRWDEEAKTLVGDMGLEAYFDDYLAGENGTVEYLKDRYGYIQPNHQQLTLTPVEHGLDFYLTFDATVQTFLEEAMDKIVKDVNPENLVAVVANPKTGEIVAMGNRGSFDPNIRDIENYNNPIISHPFEPGSTMKIFTYAAAINEGAYNGSQWYQSGTRKVNGATIGDYNRTWGTLTYDQGFYRSSNTAIVDILMDDITPDKNIAYLEAFGFGQPVGLPLPNEYSGTLPSDNDLTQKITAGFGQGILTTPVQLVQAMTAILNDGQLIKPQLIEKVYDPNEDEIIYELTPERLGTPISAATAKQVKELMIGVVEDEVGSGKAYELEHFTSGGKTGTAQIANGGKGYLTGAHDYVYSYLGFAPADDPELIMYVAMDRPTSGGHGVLGELYQYVMDNSLSYLGATKTPIVEMLTDQTEVQVDNYLNQTPETAQENAQKGQLQPIILGDGARVYAQSPSHKQTVLENQKVFLQTSEQFKLPDLLGWSKHDLILLSSLTGLEFNIKGEGFVSSQSIKPETMVTKGDQVTITLKATQSEVLDDVKENQPTESTEE